MKVIAKQSEISGLMQNMRDHLASTAHIPENEKSFWVQRGKPIDHVEVGAEELKQYERKSKPTTRVLHIGTMDITKAVHLREVLALLKAGKAEKITYYAAHGPGHFRVWINHVDFRPFIEKVKVTAERFGQIEAFTKVRNE